MILGVGFSSNVKHDGMFDFSMAWSAFVSRKVLSDIDFSTCQGFHAKLYHRNKTLAECYERLCIGDDLCESSGAALDSAEAENAIGSDAEAAGDAAEAAIAAELAGDDDATIRENQAPKAGRIVDHSMARRSANGDGGRDGTRRRTRGATKTRRWRRGGTRCARARTRGRRGRGIS